METRVEHYKRVIQSYALDDLRAALNLPYDAEFEVESMGDEFILVAMYDREVEEDEVGKAGDPAELTEMENELWGLMVPREPLTYEKLRDLLANNTGHDVTKNRVQQIVKSLQRKGFVKEGEPEASPGSPPLKTWKAVN